MSEERPLKDHLLDGMTNQYINMANELVALGIPVSLISQALTQASANFSGFAHFVQRNDIELDRTSVQAFGEGYSKMMVQFLEKFYPTVVPDNMKVVVN